MDRLQSMRVFAQVVDEGGFAAAARKLAMDPAVVTRLVVDLEAHLGVRLLQRTTRRQSLTPAGEDYLARVRAILSDIDEADAAAQSHSDDMRGTIHLLAPPVIAVHVVAPAVARFQQAHPEVLFEIHAEDTGDPAVEDYDLSLLTGAAPLRAGTVVRTIIESQAVLSASPAYLRAHGTPATPQDLARHRMLRLTTPGVRMRPLALIDPTQGDAQLEIELPATVAANSGDSLLHMAVEGAGICSQPEELIAPYLESGQLKRILAPWITGRLTVVAALPTRKFMPARTRAFLDHLVEYSRNAPPPVQAARQKARRGR